MKTQLVKKIAVGVALVVTAGCSGYAGYLPQRAVDPLTGSPLPVALTTPGDVTTTGKNSVRGSKVSGGTGIGATTGSQAGRIAPVVPGTAKGSESLDLGSADAKRPARGWPSAGLYSAEEDRIGITDELIRLCMHAAFSLGEVFDNRPQDEDIYWKAVNAEQGGIYGRKVDIRFTDDNYTPTDGVVAAEECKSVDPFFLLGGIGFDVTPAVRDWAEKNRMLYFHSFATERGAQGLRYSFSGVPSVERLGGLLAQWAARHYRNRKIGIVYRISDNWVGGRDAFKAELARHGLKVVADIGVDASQSIYTQEIQALRAAGAEVVYLHENALKWVEMIKQARSQNYKPVWMAAIGFNLITNLLKRDATDPPVESIWVTPAYEIDNPDLPWADEIERMKTAYRKYHPNNKQPNDVDWMFWLTFKSVHKMLLDCGPDCSRNTLAGMLLSDYVGEVYPLCQTNFGLGQVGGYLTNMWRAKNAPGGESAWQQIETCKPGY